MTDALRRTVDTMQEELERSVLATQILGEPFFSGDSTVVAWVFECDADELCRW